MSVRNCRWLAFVVLTGMAGAANAQGTPAPMGDGSAGAPATPAPPAAGAPAAPAAPGTAAAPAPAAPTGPAAPATGGQQAPAQPVETPETPESLSRVLVDQGLENVVVHQNDNQIRVAYENRRYRWDVTGLGVVLAAAAKEAPADAELVVTPKIWGVPDMEARVKAEDYQHFLDGSLSEREFYHRFSVGYRHGGAPVSASLSRRDATNSSRRMPTAAC